MTDNPNPTHTPAPGGQEAVLDLEAIEARLSKATPGPWVQGWGDDEHCTSIYGILSEAELRRVEAGRMKDGQHQHRGDFPKDTAWIMVDPGNADWAMAQEDNFDFIMHARKDIPALIAALREAWTHERIRVQMMRAATEHLELRAIEVAELEETLRAAHEREGKLVAALEQIREYSREQDQQDREFGVLGPEGVGYVFGLADKALAATTTPSTAAGEGGQGQAEGEQL